MKLEDKLNSDIDIAGDYEKKETYRLIREIVNNLPDRDREIIIMYFGFDGDNICTQNDIAEKFNISQSYASRVINKILGNIKSELEMQNIIETRKKRTRNKRTSPCLKENISHTISANEERAKESNKQVKVLKLKKI